MTLHYPDVSHYQAGLHLDGAPFVMIKATEGTSFIDAEYRGFVAQAMRLGIPFGAYHYLRGGNLGTQATHAYSLVGPGVPLMVDVERTQFGPADPMLSDVLTFVREYRHLGGIVHLVYLPRWYWAEDLRTPDLRALSTQDLHLVASRYTSYADTGPGWEPYGGITPTVWQYTDARPFNGYDVDFNAYRGTIQEFLSMITGGKEHMMIPLSETSPGHVETMVGHYYSEWRATMAKQIDLLTQIAAALAPKGQVPAIAATPSGAGAGAQLGDQAGGDGPPAGGGDQADAASAQAATPGQAAPTDPGA